MAASRSNLKKTDSSSVDSTLVGGVTFPTPEALGEEGLRRLRELRERRRKLKQSIGSAGSELAQLKQYRKDFAAAFNVDNLSEPSHIEQIINPNALTGRLRLQRLDTHIAQLEARIDSLTSEEETVDAEYDSKTAELQDLAKPLLERRLSELAEKLTESLQINDEIENIWWACSEVGLTLGVPNRYSGAYTSPGFPPLRKRAIINRGVRVATANDPTPVETWAAHVRKLGFAFRNAGEKGFLSFAWLRRG